jgi:chromatin segregation and condensation protein Rec8/ScpA/Scc1 (kleisin family)
MAGKSAPAIAGAARVPRTAGTSRAGRPPAASVTIDAGGRPERAARVRVPTFEGPLALLLSLIEQRQLDVLEVPLGDLAGAYLEAVAHLPDAQMPHISAFVTVCSQLILIKSRAMLPRAPIAATPGEDGVDPEAELRERLLLYRRYRDAAGLLAARLATGKGLFHRDAAMAGAAASGALSALGEDERRLRLLKCERSDAEALKVLRKLLPEEELEPAALAKPSNGRPSKAQQEQRARLGVVFLRAKAAGVTQSQLAKLSNRSVAVVSELLADARSRKPEKPEHVSP